MTIEYPGASGAETGAHRRIRFVAEEVANADFHVKRIAEGDNKRLELALTCSHFNAKLIVSNKPSTHFEFNRT